MTPKRKFIIEAETAVAIIKSHFHGNWNALDDILRRNNIETPEDIAGYDEAILKLSDVRIENILLDIEY